MPSEVERVALEMARIWTGDPRLEHPGDDFIRLARWHLREKRRARGRTLGWCLRPNHTHSKTWIASELRVEPKRRPIHDARVVAVAKGAR